MKSTGIIRGIDNLGRVVVPKEMRDKLGWGIQDQLEFYVKGNSVVLRKYFTDKEKEEVLKALENANKLEWNPDMQANLKKAIEMINNA